MWQYVNDSSGNTVWWGGSGTGGGIAAMNGEMALINGGGARVLINDLKFSSLPKINSKGFVNKLDILLKERNLITYTNYEDNKNITPIKKNSKFK